MSIIKIENVKEIEKLNYLHSYKIDYKDKLNQNKKWELVSRDDIDRLNAELYQNASFCDGTTIFATDKAKEKVVLIKEFRVSQNRYLYSLPAGLSDEGESLKETAIREFKEETGLDFEPIAVDKERYTSVGLSNEKVAFVYGFFSGTPSDKYTESSEDISVVIVDKEMAKKILAQYEVPIRTALVLKHFFNLNDFFNN